MNLNQTIQVAMTAFYALTTDNLKVKLFFIRMAGLFRITPIV